jgi:phosphocarrier protein
MIEFKVRVNNKIGVHLRAAGEFVKLAHQYRSEVTVIKNGQRANGKSILGLASLAIGRGSTLIVQVDGEDEQEARLALEALVKNNFNEE